MLKVSNVKYLRKTMVASFLGLTASAVLITPAYAQLEEITVTARKFEESLQEVPISVTAITGQNLKNAGITEFPQIASVTPNFDVRSDSVRGEFSAELNIRGQTTTTPDLSIDQAVGINVNGAPITRGTNLFGNLFDIEQVEVLRGPQGTLFGKNTTGGSVIVTTTAPKIGEFSGYGEVTVGEFSQLNLEGVVNVPINDSSALRFGAATTERDGFGDGIDSSGNRTGREFGDDDEEFFKASYLYKPNDNLSLRVNADHHTVDENGGVVRVLNTGLLFGFIPIATQSPGDDLFESADLREGQPEVSAEETNINATLEVDLGFADLTSVTSYREQESFTFLTFAPSADIPIGQDSDLFAQELRLSGRTNRLKWQTGVFFSNEEGEDFNDTGGRGDITVVENDSFSIFGQGTYSVSDRSNLTVGVRWTDEERFVERIVAGGVPQTGLTNSADFDAFSWTVAYDYDWTDDVLTYASVSRGFRSGGIDGDNDITSVVNPEFVINYEVGFKADLLEDTLRLNAAFWYSDYSDIQITSFAIGEDSQSAQGVPEIILNNAAEATLAGFEVDLQWSPNEDFSLTVGAGLIDGDFDEFLEPRLIDPSDPSAGTFQFDRSDEPIGGPDFQFSATARYGFNVTQKTRAHAQLTFTFIDERELASPALTADFTEGQAVVDSISLLNGQIDFDISDTLNVSLWGTNLADEEYFSNGFAINTLGLNLAQGNVGAPRQIGIRVRKDF